MGSEYFWKGVELDGPYPRIWYPDEEPTPAASAERKPSEPVPSSKTQPERVSEFRTRHGLTAEGMDELFGYGSKGRTTRLWETKGAPRYIGVLMAYMDRHGIEIAKDMASAAK
jgi:hypothetical protein